MIAYKIMKQSGEDGYFKTLFHGINGSKLVPVDTWLEADHKWCSDGSGGTRYLSGIHVLLDYEEALDYLENFKDHTDKVIVMCEVEDYRKKEHARHPVFLASKCRIMGAVTPTAKLLLHYVSYNDLVPTGE